MASEVSAKFGRVDPIVIQIAKMEDFSKMMEAASIAHQYFDDIFFRIPTSDPETPFLFLRFDSAKPPFTDAVPYPTPPAPIRCLGVIPKIGPASKR
jgi:hypothetical protein